MDIAALGAQSQQIQKVQGTTAPLLQRVLKAIKTASTETGVDFAYLLNKAAQESGFKTDATAKTSSATGLYQFTEQTWLTMVRQYGAKHGLGVLADKVTTRADGSATVQDRGIRQQILNLRNNPEVAAAMAGELAQENKTYLQNEIGGAIGNTELYMAHFLGAHGAAQFLQAQRGNPEAKAADLLPEAAQANRSVFYNAEGKPYSVAQLYDRFAAKMEGRGVTIPADATATQVADIGEVLNRIPSLGLGVSDRLNNAPTSAAAQQAVLQTSNTRPNLGLNVTPESLFSVMALAQLDAINPGGMLADQHEHDNDTHSLTQQAQVA